MVAWFSYKPQLQTTFNTCGLSGSQLLSVHPALWKGSCSSPLVSLQPGETFTLHFKVWPGSSWFCAPRIRCSGMDERETAHLICIQLSEAAFPSHFPQAGWLFLTTSWEPLGAAASGLLPPEVDLCGFGQSVSNFPASLSINKYCFG